MSQQLVKKGTNGKHENVMPKSWIEAIKDKNTGQTLVEILQGFNMYFLSYNGNTSATRNMIPSTLRRKGLWISYVKYDGNVYTEWYAANEIDDKSWGDSSNWRIGNNTLVGDITISANGNWVINGTETEFKAVGEKGNTPLIRVANNRLQVSYDLGDTYIDVTNNPVYTKFRWLATTGDTQANNVGRIQASTDEGKTWTNMSNDFTNNLHISRYIGVSESLPTSDIAEGTIYAKGPYYAEGDTLNDNPIYRLWVYAWKGDTLAWQDNGEFQSIAAGVVQETGDSETEVMSQKAVSTKLSELGSQVSKTYNGNYTKSDFSDNYMIDVNGNIITNDYFRVLKNVPVSKGDIVKTIGVTSDNPNVCCIAAYSANGDFLSEKSVFVQYATTYQYEVGIGVAYLAFGTLLTTSNVSVEIERSTALTTLRSDIEVLDSNVAQLNQGVKTIKSVDFSISNVFIEIDGKEVYNSVYNTTDFILIKGVKMLSVNAVMGNQYGGGIAFYDKGRNFISSLYGKTSSEIGGYELSIADIPNDAWYCKVQGRNDKDGLFVECIVAPNAELNAMLDYGKQILWQRAIGIYSDKAENLSTNEYLILEDSPNIRNSYVIQASAIVRTMGRLRISKGTGAYAAGIVDIDATNIYEYNPNNPTAYNTYEHGINISDFVRITIKVDAMPMTALITGKARLILESVGGRYEKDIMWNGGNNNVIFFNTSANLGTSELTMSVKGKDVWYFGDSYLDFWTPVAYKMGANNILIDGYSGRASEAAYISLLREIKVNLPKKIVWGMGMNDGDSSDAVNATWKYFYEQLIILCNKYGIEPILVTIPNTPTVTNYYKNEIIRASGYRYLDIAAIMGANEKGSAWYSGLLSGDNVHPNTLGAEIIATYIVAQLAEIVE